MSTQNYPNAAKLLSSLRHLDYNNESAICDIIDNSIDAGASLISVKILENENEINQIEIIDNGSGMDKETLDEAFKLGSNTEKNPAYDLGLYGMGLITSSLSLGKKLEVVTKNNGNTYRSSQDLEIIINNNDFIKELEDADEIITDDFQKELRNICIKYSESSINHNYDSGTKVIISKIDKCDWKRLKSFCDRLISHLGQTYRKFIQAGKCTFVINNEIVKPIDPIYDFEPNILMEDQIIEEEGVIKIIISEIKDYGQEINKNKKINISNQGFYILRNNREICFGDTLSLWTKHNNFNCLRIEFSYPATLDYILNSTFSKQGIRLSQSINDKVNVVCQPFIRQVNKNAKKRQDERREEKSDYSEVEKYITQKSHLLKKPKAEIEQRNSPTESKPHISTTEIKHGPRLDLTKRKRVDINSLKVKFQVYNKFWGEKGPLFDVDQEKDVIIVKWNSEHPFYQNVVLPNEENPDIFNPLAYLIYCYASAELIAKEGSDSLEIIENIRYDVGRNLAILLK